MTLQSGTDRVLTAVRRVPMFRGLTEADQRRVASYAVIRDLQRGDALWEEGDPAETLTIILKGRIKILRRTDGGDVIFEIFGEGEPVGAVAVYNCMPYPASAVCLEPVTVLLLPRRDYFELLDRHPDFARAIIRELTRLTLALTRKIEDMRGHTVDARIAQLFLTLAKRMGKETPEGVVVPITLSRQEVADLVGTTVESAIRTLSRWGREKVLISGRGRFVIPSLERLREQAGISAPEA